MLLRDRVLLVEKRLRGSYNLQTAKGKLLLSFALFSSAGQHQGEGEELPAPPADGEQAADGELLRFSLEELQWSRQRSGAGALVRKYGKRSKMASVLGV